MSQEAWGDEGNVPESIEDTAMYQEFLDIIISFDKWCQDHKDYVSNDETGATINALRGTFEVLQEKLRED